MNLASSMQLLKNFISNVLSLIVSVGTGLVIPALVVRYMDVSAYGLIQISLTLTLYFSIFLNSINEVLVKDLAVNLEKSNSLGLERVLSTTFFLLLLISVILFLVGIYISVNATIFFDIPHEYSTTAKYLFLGSFVSFLLIIMTNYYMAVAYARNRLDYCQVVIIGRNILRFCLISATVFWLSSLTAIGVSFVVAALAGLLASLLYYRKHFGQISISINKIDRLFFDRLLRLSGWIVLNQVGVIVFSYLDVILINILLGSDVAGQYALLLQWRVLIYTILGTMVQLFYPMFLQYFARGDYQGLNAFFFLGLKLVLIFGGLITGGIYLGASEILRYWVGEEFIFLADLMRVVVSHWFVFSAFVLFNSLYLVYSKIKLIAVVNFLFGIVYFVFVYLSIVLFDAGLWGVGYTSLIVLSLRNFVVVPILSTRVFGFELKGLYRIMIMGLFPFGFMVMVGSIWRYDNIVNSGVGAVFYFFLLTFFVAIVSYFIALTKGEKMLLESKVLSLLKKNM